jgi:hypothetical protein
MAEILGQKANAGRALAMRSKDFFGGSTLQLQFQPNMASRAHSMQSKSLTVP